MLILSQRTVLNQTITDYFKKNLPKLSHSNAVSNPISLGMEPVKELEAVLYVVSKIAREGFIFHRTRNEQ